MKLIYIETIRGTHKLIKLMTDGTAWHVHVNNKVAFMGEESGAKAHFLDLMMNNGA